MVKYMQENGNPINGGRVPYVLEDLVEIALKHYVEESFGWIGANLRRSARSTHLVDMLRDMNEFFDYCPYGPSDLLHRVRSSIPGPLERLGSILGYHRRRFCARI